MKEQGFSRDLQHRYLKSGWLEVVGVGAFKRPSENLKWQGGVYTLQNQSKHHVHVGGLTALSLLGFAHYTRTSGNTLDLFSPQGSTLPAWFKKYDWNVNLNYVRTSFLPEGLGLISHEDMNLTLTISSAERAFFECLYLTPKKMDMLEVYQIMSGLISLRPKLLNKLLEQCSSIKVKRLFLYMADKTNHQWFKGLNIDDVDLGKGDRSIVKNGVYNSTYRITVPSEVAQL